MTFSDPDSAPGPVPARTEEPTLGVLVHDLPQQIPELIRSELRLVALVLLAGAAVVAFAGKKQVDQATPAMPERAVEGVKEDIATIKGQRT